MSGKEPFQYYFFLHFEWIALICGLLLMAFSDPFSQAHTLCPVERLGVEFCPGSGLGTSIAFAARGNLSASLQSHPLGLFAILVIVARSGFIFRRNYNFNKQRKHEKNI